MSDTWGSYECYDCALTLGSSGVVFDIRTPGHQSAKKEASCPLCGAKCELKGQRDSIVMVSKQLLYCGG